MPGFAPLSSEERGVGPTGGPFWVNMPRGQAFVRALNGLPAVSRPLCLESVACVIFLDEMPERQTSLR